MHATTVAPTVGSSAALPVHPSLLDRYVGDEVRRVCRGWLKEHVDDISQATYLRVVHRLRQRPTTRVTPAYLRQAARHAVFDAVRRHHRRSTLWSIHQSSSPLGLGPCDPETSTLGRELGRAIREQLERLPEARREAVELYLQGHGITEIAERLGCPRKRIDNLVCRGIATLRRELAALGFTPVRDCA